MKYKSAKTPINTSYLSLFTDLELTGNLEQAGPLVDPEQTWTVEPFVEIEDEQGNQTGKDLDQPIVLSLQSETGKVLSPLAGSLFINDTSIYIETSQLNSSDDVWWPFPTPIYRGYDAMIENPHVRIFPGIFNFKYTGEDNLGFNQRVKASLKKAIILSFFNFSYPFLMANLQEIQTVLSAPDPYTEGVSFFNSCFDQNNLKKYSKLDGFLKEFIMYNDKEGYYHLPPQQPANSPVPFIVSPSTVTDLDDLASKIFESQGKLGIKIQVSTPIVQLNAGETIEITTQDWRCYAHPFRPLAILNSKTTSDVDVLTSSNYTEVYARSKLPMLAPTVWETDNSINLKNYLNDGSGGFKTTSATGNWNTAYTEDRIRIDEGVLNVLEEESLVVKDSNGTLYFVELDRYEKWSLFSSNIRTVYAHWYTSGFLHESYRSDAVTLNLLKQRYREGVHIDGAHSNNVYFHQPYSFLNGMIVSVADTDQFQSVSPGLNPSMPDSIDLPEPINFNYIEYDHQNDNYTDHKYEGELLGESIRAIDYDMTQYKLYINEENSEDYLVKSAIRPYSIPGEFYRGNLGAYGLEEYVVRVPFKEIPNPLSDGSALRFEAEAGVRKNIELLKAKMIIARTYHMGRGRSFSYDYGQVSVPATSDWQVMSLGHYNSVIRALDNIEINGAIELSGKGSESIRLMIEDVMYETWGEVFLSKGVITEAIFKGNYGGNQNISGVRADRETTSGAEYKRDFYFALRRVFTPANHSDASSDGAGFGQAGGELLVDAFGVSSHQMIHWYFYGVHILNSWGSGDCISRFPISEETVPDSSNAFPWLAWKDGLTKFPLPSTQVYSEGGIWRLHDETGSVRHDNISGDEFRTDSEVWSLGRYFKSNEFDDVQHYIISDPDNSESDFMVSRDLVFKIDRLRNHQSPDQIKIYGNSDIGSIQSFLLTSSGALFQEDHLKKLEIQETVFFNNGSNTVLIFRGPHERMISSRNYSSGKENVAIDHSLLNKFFGEGHWIELVDKDHKNKYYYLVKSP